MHYGRVGIRVIRAPAERPPRPLGRPFARGGNGAGKRSWLAERPSPTLLRGRWPLRAPKLKIRNPKPESRQALPHPTEGTARGEKSCVIVPFQFALPTSFDALIASRSGLDKEPRKAGGRKIRNLDNSSDVFSDCTYGRGSQAILADNLIFRVLSKWTIAPSGCSCFPAPKIFGRACDRRAQHAPARLARGQSSWFNAYSVIVTPPWFRAPPGTPEPPAV
jgi:hypothetical protein